MVANCCQRSRSPDIPHPNYCAFKTRRKGKWSGKTKPTSRRHWTSNTCRSDLAKLVNLIHYQLFQAFSSIQDVNLAVKFSVVYAGYFITKIPWFLPYLPWTLAVPRSYLTAETFLCWSPLLACPPGYLQKHPPPTRLKVPLLEPKRSFDSTLTNWSHRVLRRTGGAAAHCGIGECSEKTCCLKSFTDRMSELSGR